jgi:hypothetical protein
VDLSAASVAELNAELVRKTAGPDALDSLFTLPDWITNQALREAYEVMVARMRHEAANVSMNTVQQLLMERLAFNYVVLRTREDLPLGDLQGFQDARSQRDFNTFWLSTTKEFNDLLAKNIQPNRDGVLLHVQRIVADVLGTIDDGALRNELIQRFVETFEREGLVRV